MKKLFLIMPCLILFISCLEPSQEKLDSTWLKSVKGKTFIASNENHGFIVFDDSAGMSYTDKKMYEEDASGGDVIMGLLSENLFNFKFSRSPDKNKAVYEMNFLFMSSYVGLSINGKNLYMHGGSDGELVKIPDDINWDVPDENIFILYKGK